MDNKDYIRVLLYSYYTTITGWGVLLMYPETAHKAASRGFPLGFWFNVKV